MLLSAPLSKFLATCLTRSIQACKNECLVLSGMFSQMSFVSLFLSLWSQEPGEVSCQLWITIRPTGACCPCCTGSAFYLSQLVRTGVGMGWRNAQEGFAQMGKVAVKSAPAAQRVTASFQFELVWKYAEMSVARFFCCFNNRLWCRLLPASCWPKRQRELHLSDVKGATGV